MRERLCWVLLGATSTALVGLLASAASAPDDLPPHVDAGGSIYGIELVRPASDQILPGVGPATEVKVLGHEGKWFLLETPDQPRGPQWVNFDQVVSYRTRQ